MPKSKRKPARPSSPQARLLPGALIVGFGAFVVIFYSISLPGVAWDEAGTISGAHRYLEWFRLGPREALTEKAIDEYWVWGAEHPPFGRLLAAAGMSVFSNLLGLLQAARIGPAASFGLLCALIFYLMAKHRGVPAGILSAASFAFMPRILGHAMLAELDLPLAMTWFLTVVLFVKSMESESLWFLPGLGFGLALLTKFNAAFIIVPLGIWGLAVHRHKAIIPLAATLVIGLAVFFAGWPWLWHHPIDRLSAYIADKLHRAAVETFYLGKVYAETPAPWHYPLVMTFVTLPPIILVATVYGLLRSLTELRRSPLFSLLLLNLAVIYGVAMLPRAPKYDGMRLFLPAFPFLACFAGAGFADLWEHLGKLSRNRPYFPPALLSLLFAFELLSVALVYPFGLSYYSLLIGGPKGAEALGFETTYWGEVVDGNVMEFLNRYCEPGSRIALFPYGSQAIELLPFIYQVHGDLKFVQEWEKPYQYMVVINRQGKLNGPAKHLLDYAQPIYSKRRAGVTLCAVYRVAPPTITSPGSKDTSEAPSRRGASTAGPEAGASTASSRSTAAAAP